jgi:hypothetical protein
MYTSSNFAADARLQVDSWRRHNFAGSEFPWNATMSELENSLTMWIEGEFDRSPFVAGSRT